MRFPKRSTALVLAGAVGLSSVAYGIGTQAGDGSAAARDSSAAADRRLPGPGVGDLANGLGVSAAALRDALREYHEQERADGRDAFAAALARELGVSRAELRKGLREVRAGADERFEQRRSELVAFLATRFNLPESEVEDALPAFVAGSGGPRPGMNGGPPPGHHGHGGPGGPPFP